MNGLVSLLLAAGIFILGYRFGEERTERRMHPARFQVTPYCQKLSGGTYCWKTEIVEP